MPMISVAIRMKRILSCSIFWRKLGYVYCGKVPIDGERLAYQKIKTKREKAFYQELDEAAHHGIH